MIQLRRQTIQATLDIGKRRQGLLPATPTESLKFARASGLRIEVTITQGSSVVDITNLTSLTMEAKQTNAPNGTLAMVRTVGAGELTPVDGASAGWLNHEAGVCHAAFLFSVAETSDGVFGASGSDDEKTHFVTFYGTLKDDTERCELGTGILTSYNAGVTGAVVSPPAGQTLPSLEQIQAMLQGYVPFNVPAGKVVRFLLDDGTALQVGAAYDATLGSKVKIFDFES